MRTGDDLLRTFKGLVEEQGKLHQGVFESITIGAEPLKLLVDLIDDVGNLVDVNADIKGEAFEYFLRSYQKTHSDFAQYFTPRHIIELMVRMGNPRINHRVYDPFCGTGGMLISAYRHMAKNLPSGSTTQRAKQLRKLREESIFGKDISLGARLAKMNMILIGDGHCNIEKVDTFKTKARPEYDFVFTNIPFNLRRDSDQAVDSNELAIQHCFESLRPTGQAFIIVPVSVAEEKRYASLRQRLAKHTIACIRLPREVFRRYTNVRACIIHLAKEPKGCDTIDYFEVLDDGFSNDVIREPHGRESDIDRLIANDQILQTIPIVAPDYRFRPSDESVSTQSKYPMKSLRELVKVRRTKTPLDDNRTYVEPRVTQDQTVSVSKERQGRNIKARKKVLAQRGDLIISRLHTQNGLFAYCDREYATTSQLVCAVNVRIITKEFLHWMLRSTIRQLKKDDLVGREQYSEAEILDLQIPVPSLAIQRRHIAKLKALQTKVNAAKRTLDKQEQRFRKAMFNS